MIIKGRAFPLAAAFLIGGTITLGFISFFGQVAQAASFYTPFGGRVEAYIPQSEAPCIKNTCGLLEKPVETAVKKAIAGPVASICSGVSIPCSVIPLLGNAACFAACVEAINKAVENSISLCAVEEIRVGPPKPASVGILHIGDLKIEITIRIPPKIGPKLFSVNLGLPLGKLLPVFDFIPDARLYKYADYKTEGNWVLGDSLNLLNACKVGETVTEAAPPPVCKMAITKAVLKVLGEGQKASGDEAYKAAIQNGASAEAAEEARKKAAGEYILSCPLLNLVHQMGTSRAP
jgi:hypothetical protein